MPITVTAEPAVIDGARSYAERNGMTFEAFVLAYLESAAKRERGEDVHAYFAEYDAVIRVPDGELIESDDAFPKSKLRLVQVRVDLHAAELMENWRLIGSDKKFFRISPLEVK